MDGANLPEQEAEKPSEKHGFSLFKKKEEPKPEEETQAPSAAQSINEIEARLKMVEERYNDLSRRTQFMDKTLLDERKRITKEIKLINSDILEIKREINNMTIKIELIITELKSCARKDELNTLSKYIDLWEPLNFATRKQVEDMINEKLAEKQEKPIPKSIKAKK
jgi:hypothetical protein